MHEGEIIKFYRIKAGLTQEQLGKGICSSKHVGKIERGQTSYSSEIILLFSERLHIDIQEEIINFNNLEKKLLSWHNSIIKQSMIEVEKTKKELKKNPFINSSNYAPLNINCCRQDIISCSKILKRHMPFCSMSKETIQIFPLMKRTYYGMYGAYII